VQPCFVLRGVDARRIRGRLIDAGNAKLTRRAAGGIDGQLHHITNREAASGRQLAGYQDRGLRIRYGRGLRETRNAGGHDERGSERETRHRGIIVRAHG
jgi:hypothetical protein